MSKRSFNLDQLQSHMAHADPKEFWRSVEEISETDEFQEFLRLKVPRHGAVFSEIVSRRDFLRLMGASLALAGLGACGGPTRTDEKIVPYVKQPEEIVPGRPLYFATAFAFGAMTTGVLVESHEGRPTKIEGNPSHPSSLGTTDIFTQASLLTLYDPDRSQVVTNAGRITTWKSFLSGASAALEAQRLDRGAGLRILTESLTSPTLARQLNEFLAKFSLAKWHRHESLPRENMRQGSQMAFGDSLNTYYRLDEADVVVSFDADFLYTGPGNVRYAHDFAARRKINEGKTTMNRLYVIEATPTVTGAMADHRLSVAPSEIECLAAALARHLGVLAKKPGEQEISPDRQRWINAVARDLQKHRGRSVVTVGDSQPPRVHAWAHVMNHALDNVSKTVIHTDPVEYTPQDDGHSLRELVEDMNRGRVELLIILGANPVFTAPVDLGFAEALSKVKLRVRLGLYEDETSNQCHWHVPEAHYLEAWSDVRAHDGTASIIQPLIAPLYDGQSVHEFLSALMGEPGRSGYDIVRRTWQQRSSQDANFEHFWRSALHDGVIAGTALPRRPVNPKPIADHAGESKKSAGNASGLELVFRPDPTVFDGTFANNGWLQELPKPLTKLTWDNAALISPSTAQRLGLENGDLTELRYEGRSLRAPAWITPGQADNTVTVHLGYGRTHAGKVGSNVGFNAYIIRSSDAPWQGSGVEVNKIGGRYPLASTQDHHSMEGRDLIRLGTLEKFREDHDFVHKIGHQPKKHETLYPAHPYEGHAWGMSIDLNACLGCNACVVACQAENNIPIVGKDEVARGREMHWIRIDRYYRGEMKNPETYHQPVLCMHCENAPCEIVCPVGATVHSSEGLNDMVYNRCVGTRYCANNCPYKVRRFNFYQYADFETPSLKLMRNPDVTVRSGGVMEKCTYCVQRINAAKIQAEKEDRGVRDGDIVTACQAACPAQAITFGDINDPESRVSKLKSSPLSYGLLTELNTRPRTTYLAKLKNPNPEIEKE